MKKVFFILLIIGIVLRFVVHFLYPSFNVDEISLGNNIKHSSFIELLYPLKNFQSSPPLYLWIQKLIVSISPLSFWINIKILSFCSSILGIILFFFFIKKNNYNPVFLLMFVIILFNPFNIFNSLTVKQYTFDLTGILFLMLYFRTKLFNKYNWIFFVFWCLISNIGLFACAGYLVYEFFTQNNSLNFKSIFSFLRKKILTILAPFPYVFYFFWYMKQDGAKEMKNFMVNYWRDSFLPINKGIFSYSVSVLHEVSTHLLCSVSFFGILLLVLVIPVFYFMFKSKVLFKQELLLLSSIILVHLILNICQLYPFSDRLFLYISPLIVLSIGSSIDSIFKSNKFQYPFVIIISIVTMFMYSLYLPYKENDVLALYNKLENLNIKQAYITNKSKSCINDFNDFSDNKFKTQSSFVDLDSTLEKSDFIISRVHKKMAYHKTASEEPEIQNLLNSNKIVKLDKVNGYNIYKIK